jgi:hypothetical protein
MPKRPFQIAELHTQNFHLQNLDINSIK